MTQTKAIDLINPEVMADAISAKLPQAIRFAPFARIDTKLVGQPGDTITRPKYAYIGAAEDLVEGLPMDTTKLSMSTTKVTVKETGKAVEITERAILTNVSGTLEEAENQILLALKDKVEIDYLTALGETQLSFNGTATNAESILDAVDVFDDEDEQDYILFVNTKDYTKLVKSLLNTNGQTGQTALTSGQVSELVGVKDIVRTKRLAEGTSYLQKQGAVEIVLKKYPEIKADEDILNRTVVITGNEYYTVNLYNDAGVVKIQATGSGE
ncbi:N4-gp56 family major capsid protein [Alkalihalobacillus trypoxylicola]|uniref:Major capsid protein n=1 Tax=Alkalihalobacillus trypoxylicola TaxID=519424 RepID=A0A162F6R4_9BACI|nr:N4-gp56 family major capsid protein [Alkalihalobacillus trypoxylicola]KYG34915.1 major capsid protein [Alkalihalobacillus trypoxylicola]